MVRAVVFPEPATPPHRGRFRRGGFTLVELLVVIAIIGVLVGLLMPAVQSAREASRRTECSNQLKQMGLAFHNFQDVKGHLPNGGRDGDVGDNPDSACCNSIPVRGWSWLFHILPYMEQTNVYDLAESDDDPTVTSNLVAQQLIPVYYCPSRRAPLPQGSGFYRADYAGNAGQWTQGSGVRAKANNGTTGVVIKTDSSKLTLERIRDGSSNTIMLGEKGLHPDHYEDSGNDGGDNERWNNAGWDEDIIRHGAFLTNDSEPIEIGIPPLPDIKIPNAANGWADPYDLGEDKWHPYFGSPHPGGMNTCMADGSVRIFDFDVDREVFRRASLSKSGLPVNFE